MSSQGLFQLTHDSFVPVTDRLEPLLWIQEMVLLQKPNVNEVIRTVPFHRGLNVIRTEERLPGESKVVAHSVGKTLLMRLIRYTLGEDNYADSESQSDLAQSLPEAHVVAHWRVNSNDWIVIRPLHDHSQKAVRCMRGSEWQQLVGDDSRAVSMKEFLEEIEIAVFRNLPSFETAKGHSPKWSDVLGWLARDCECGYRQANEWRHADTNLGKPADLGDNSLLLQWLCGLMSVEECVLRKEHWETLGAGNRAKHQMERLQRNLDSLRENLADEVKKVQLEAEQQQETEFSLILPRVITFAGPVEKRAKQLNELHEDIKEQSGLAELEQREVSIGLELVTAAKSLAILETTLALKTTHRDNLRASDRDPSILSKCPDPCKLRDQLQRDRTAGKDNAEESHLVTLSQEIKDASDDLRSSRVNHERIETELKNVRERIERTRAELEVSVGVLNQSIGNWNSYVAEAKRMDRLTSEFKSNPKSGKIWRVESPPHHPIKTPCVRS